MLSLYMYIYHIVKIKIPDEVHHGHLRPGTSRGMSNGMATGMYIGFD